MIPANPSFETVLIANRGAIARRIARSCRELGYGVIMVYTPEDCHPEWLSLADLCLEIPELADRSGYLNIQALVEAAHVHRAAIHPGYGFLSESAEFARACAQAGVPWIGPSAEVLERSGNKAICATLLKQAGLPLLPSLPCSQADEQSLQALEVLGFPLLLKPVHGGGGIGMRLVENPGSLKEALGSSLEQAGRFFGEAAVLAERWLPAARHIEVQLLADASGQVRSLFERECSWQRRRQKVVEEAPSPALNQAQRERLFELALQAARTIGLDQVGTVEFLWDGQDFWFLEINPRLQVEHAVSEAISGLDLVECQLAIAQGQRLEQLECCKLPQQPQGHAIEARLYAEHPWTGLPAAGHIYQLRLPDGQGLRLELGVYAGMQVSSRFDPLLLKLIAHGPTRERARQRLLAALESLEISGNSGFATNQPALAAILASPEFRAGDYHTASLEALKPVAPEADTQISELVKLLADFRSRPQAQAQTQTFWRPAFWT